MVDTEEPERDGATTDPLAATVLGEGSGTQPNAPLGTDALSLRLASGAPTRVGRYRLVRPLGEGGMGVVYLAHDDELDRPVAIKLLAPDRRDEPGRLIREARSMARLAHPNIASVFDVGEHDDTVYVAMEYVEGPSLRAYLGSDHGWSARRDKLMQAGAGLVAAHDAGIVHRDFKPDNVIVGKDGRVRVLDFGLAKLGQGATGAGDDTSTVAGRLMGTPRYMAPEQLRCETAMPASDQFAFCVTAYEAAYGRRPFRGEVFAEIAASVLAGAPQEPPQSPEVPAELWPVLRRGLSLDKQARFDSMRALLKAFGEASDPKLALVSRPAMRDARDGARDQLAGAFAEDLLDADELDDRMERLENARSPATVDHVVADLVPHHPASPTPVEAPTQALANVEPPPKRTIAIFSSAERKTLSTDRANKMICVFGSIELDLRDTPLPPLLEVHATVGFGSLEITIPPGVVVELDALAIMGSSESDATSVPADTGAPRIRVTGYVIFGSIEVKERLPGEGWFAARKRRKKAQRLQAANSKALPPGDS